MRLITFCVLITLSSGAIFAQAPTSAPAQIPAANCNTVNLITQPNSPFQKVPVYDQDGNDMCYAYSTAQLADYHLIKNGAPGRNVHPAWAALVQARNRNRNRLSSGLALNGIEGLRQDRNCGYETVERALKVWADQAHVTEAEIMNFLDKFGLSMQSGHGTVSENITGTLANPDNQIECSANSTYSQLAPMISELNVTTYNRFVESILMPACQNERTEVALPPPASEFGATGSETLTKMASRLDQNNEPVAISYCLNVWSDPSYDQNNPRYQKDPQDACGRHVSIVAGKKMIGDSCHILVRNTWGTSWSMGAENYTCVCRHKKTQEYIEDCTASTHNNGQYTVEGCWLNESVLAPNVMQFTYLQSGSSAAPAAPLNSPSSPPLGP